MKVYSVSVQSVVGRMCQNAAFVAQSQERRMQEAVRLAEEEGGALGAAECHTRVTRRAIELLLHHPQFRHLQVRALVPVSLRTRFGAAPFAARLGFLSEHTRYTSRGAAAQGASA